MEKRLVWYTLRHHLSYGEACDGEISYNFKVGSFGWWRAVAHCRDRSLSKCFISRSVPTSLSFIMQFLLFIVNCKRSLNVFCQAQYRLDAVICIIKHSFFWKQIGQKASVLHYYNTILIWKCHRGRKRGSTCVILVHILMISPLGWRSARCPHLVTWLCAN